MMTKRLNQTYVVEIIELFILMLIINEAIFINITEFIQTLNVFNHIIDTYWKLHLVEKVKAERLA